MNITERNEVVLRLATLGFDALTDAQRKQASRALAKFGAETALRRKYLDASRARRQKDKRKWESYEFMWAELRRILPCSTCGVVGGNPLFSCTGDFGCALERLRCRSSEFHVADPEQKS